MSSRTNDEIADEVQPTMFFADLNHFPDDKRDDGDNVITLRRSGNVKELPAATIQPGTLNGERQFVFMNGLPYDRVVIPTLGPRGSLDCTVCVINSHEKRNAFSHRPYECYTIDGNDEYELVRKIHPLDVWAIKIGAPEKDIPFPINANNCKKPRSHFRHLVGRYICPAKCYFCKLDGCSDTPCGHASCPSFNGKLLTTTCTSCGTGGFWWYHTCPNEQCPSRLVVGGYCSNDPFNHRQCPLAAEKALVRVKMFVSYDPSHLDANVDNALVSQFGVSIAQRHSDDALAARGNGAPSPAPAVSGSGHGFGGSAPAPAGGASNSRFHFGNGSIAATPTGAAGQHDNNAFIAGGSSGFDVGAFSAAALPESTQSGGFNFSNDALAARGNEAPSPAPAASGSDYGFPLFQLDVPSAQQHPIAGAGGSSGFNFDAFSTAALLESAQGGRLDVSNDALATRGNEALSSAPAASGSDYGFPLSQPGAPIVQQHPMARTGGSSGFNFGNGSDNATSTGGAGQHDNNTFVAGGSSGGFNLVGSSAVPAPAPAATGAFSLGGRTLAAPVPATGDGSTSLPLTRTFGGYSGGSNLGRSSAVSASTPAATDINLGGSAAVPAAGFSSPTSRHKANKTTPTPSTGLPMWDRRRQLELQRPEKKKKTTLFGVGGIPIGRGADDAPVDAAATSAFSFGGGTSIAPAPTTGGTSISLPPAWTHRGFSAGPSTSAPPARTFGGFSGKSNLGGSFSVPALAPATADMFNSGGFNSGGSTTVPAQARTFDLEEAPAAAPATSQFPCVGCRVAKYFGKNVYFGSVIRHIPPRNDNDCHLWRVKFDDNGEMDFGSNDLNKGLKLYNKRKEENAMPSEHENISNSTDNSNESYGSGSSNNANQRKDN